MDRDIIIKGNSYGIVVILNEYMSLNQLSEALWHKFQNALYFFKGEKQIGVIFKGRKLTEKEEQYLLKIINSIPNLEVDFYVNTDFENHDLRETKREICLPKFTKKNVIKTNREKPGVFYRGNLKNGSTLEVDTSVVILGDVETGATVISKGNVVILGNLYGSAYAGMDHRKNRFVLALNMNPVQINIDTVQKKFIGQKKNKKATNEAVIAICENGQIILDHVSHNSLQDKLYQGY